jgi:hypothetical protein
LGSLIVCLSSLELIFVEVPIFVQDRLGLGVVPLDG